MKSQSHSVKTLPSIFVTGSDETFSSISGSLGVTNLSVDELTTALGIVDNSGPIYNYFNVEIKSDEGPSINLLDQSATGIQIQTIQDNVHSEKPDWYSEYTRALSFYIDEKRYQEAAKELKRCPSETHQPRINYSINKIHLNDEILTILPDISGVSVSYWSSPNHLSNWVENKDPSKIVEKLFKVDNYPIFVFENDSFSRVSNSFIYINIDEVEDLTKESLKDMKSNYIEKMEIGKEMMRNNTNSKSISASLFESQGDQDLFSKVFLYSVFGSIAEEMSVREDGLLFTLESEKGTIEDKLEFRDWSTRNEFRKNLLELYNQFIQRGDRDVYRDLWHQAIIEYSDSAQDIADHHDDIIHYYESLEESAIRGNFEELSGAVQDAQIFISDVTNTLSTTTVNLTSEIQKIVFALFGVIATNAFLIIRESQTNTAILFTVLFLCGLLSLYFPTTQERVNELKRIIEEGDKDTKLYISLVNQAGADDFIDTDQFRDRQKSYIKLAEKRYEWTNKRLKIAFSLFAVAWGIGAAYLIGTAPTDSVFFLLPLSTAGVAFWISDKQSDNEYYTDDLIFSPVTIPPMKFVLLMILASVTVRVLLISNLS